MLYAEMDQNALRSEYAAAQAQYAALRGRGLKLDMSRGKPGREDLDLVSDLFTVLGDSADCLVDGMDARNYGGLDGLPCAKALFADILGCRPEQIFVGGNASLQLMYDTVAKAYTHGLLHSESPWCKQAGLKFLCPAPGYDRHFRVTESFGFELVTIPMTEFGPDMDTVEAAVKDPHVKGIWCVPKYSNPEGVIYSQETIARIAALRPAAPDFLLMWDNAYCIHEFEGDFQPFPDILSLCAAAGNADMPFEFASTSKITFPGAGVAVMAASEANLAYMRKLISVQTIGYDKLNQLRHVRYLKDKDTTLALMQKHAAVLRPKFHAVLDALDAHIAPLGIAQWKRPVGGYFVSLDAMEHTASRTLSLCAEAGVTMTPAGATFPYGKDPADSNIRIAPSLPPVEELRAAMDIFCVCLRMAALERLMG